MQMLFEDVERALGADVVGGVRAAVRQAFVVARSLPDGEGERALESLLAHLLVTVMVTPENSPTSAARVDLCCQAINAAAAKARELYASKTKEEHSN